MSTTIAQTLDLKGLSCPLPIVKTAMAMKAIESGQLLEALATDPGSVPDFAAWCRSTGNELVEQTTDDGVLFRHQEEVRKRWPKRRRTRSW